MQLANIAQIAELAANLVSTLSKWPQLMTFRQLKLRRCRRQATGADPPSGWLQPDRIQPSHLPVA